MIATKIEQSKNLIKLGLNINTADMRWFSENNNTIPVLISGFSIGWYEAFEYSTKSVYEPAWSFDALWKIISNVIKSKRKTSEYYSCEISTTMSGCQIKFQKAEQVINTLNSTKSKDLVDAVYKMVCWLLKENYI